MPRIPSQGGGSAPLFYGQVTCDFEIRMLSFHIVTQQLLVFCHFIVFLESFVYLRLLLGKNQALKFIKPQAQGSPSSTWDVVRRELGFKYRDPIRTTQSRPSETTGKGKLN